VPKIWGETVADHKDRLRATIVESTVALVAERGRADVTMSAVAERVGIGRATVYNFFPDLDAILATYVVGQFDRQHAVLDERLAAVDDPLEELRIALELVIGYFATAEHRDASPIGLDTFGPGSQDRVDAAHRGFRDRLAALMARAIAAGLIRPELDPDFAADALNHLLAAGREDALRGTRPAAAIADDVYRLFVDGAGTPKARRRTRR
jgi:AcrR family transcriptional regulator